MSNEVKPKIDRRKTPEHAEHMRKIGFKKGDGRGGRASGGGRVATPPEVKAAMAEKTHEAVEIMYDLMYNSSNESVRWKAAAYFLDAMVAKAPTQSEVKVNHTHSIADMLAEVNALRLSDNSKTIDITPTRIEDAVLVPLSNEDNKHD